jgi:hypothetical protein
LGNTPNTTIDLNTSVYSTRVRVSETKNAIFSNQQLSHILVNYLTLANSESNSLSKKLSLRLFQNIESNPNLVPTLQCFKRLFTAVDVLSKPKSLNPGIALLGDSGSKVRVLQLLSHPSFQRYTSLVVDFYLLTKHQLQVPSTRTLVSSR